MLTYLDKLKMRSIFMKKVISAILAVIFALSCIVSCQKSKDLLTYQYDFDLSEYIKLGEYKGLPADGYRYDVTEEDIKNQVMSTLAYYAKSEKVTDRGAKFGDTVYIDYVGTIDGETFPGGSESNCEVTLGFKTFIDGFEESIVGLFPGESVSVDLTFPEPYKTNPDLAGKDVHFDITLNLIFGQQIPAYTDDFVKAYLGFDSIEEYEENLRNKMDEHYKTVYYEYVIGQTWDVLLENTEVIKYPEAELKQAYDDYVNSAKAYAEYQNMKFVDYLSVFYNMNEEEFYEHAKEYTKATTKEEMICYAIARLENISISEEEYVRRATIYATEYYELASLEALEAIYDKEVLMEVLLFDIVHERVADYAELNYLN